MTKYSTNIESQMSIKLLRKQSSKIFCNRKLSKKPSFKNLFNLTHKLTRTRTFPILFPTKCREIVQSVLFHKETRPQICLPNTVNLKTKQFSTNGLYRWYKVASNWALA